MRTNFDFTPYRRSTVGFDRLFDLLETEPRGDVAEGYPPFDIVKDGEDSYRVTPAIAGFRSEEIEVVAQQNQPSVTGKRAGTHGADDRKRVVGGTSSQGGVDLGGLLILHNKTKEQTERI